LRKENKRLRKENWKIIKGKKLRHYWGDRNNISKSIYKNKISYAL
jgi:hypothetical protein